MKIVADASALVDVLLGVDLQHAIATRLLSGSLHAPVTVDAEVLHAFRRRWLARLITEEEAQRAIIRFQATPISRHPVQPLVRRMWHLRRNVTTYDAAYVALAESLDAPLVTRDARLACSAGHTARIEYIE